jgi:aspartate racemase
VRLDQPLKGKNEGRSRIGIVAGSGPEAGIDLWQKILSENRKVLGPSFRGDIDTPYTVIVSDPYLGHSMDFPLGYESVWEALASDIATLDGQVDMFAIACNTLHCFSDAIRALSLSARFVSLPEAVAAYIEVTQVKRVALLGAASVMSLGPLSPYASLNTLVEIEPLDDLIPPVHQLILDIKRLGPADPGLASRFEGIIDAIASDVILLACTELPLLDVACGRRTLVDVNLLVARELAQSSLNVTDTWVGSSTGGHPVGA